ncbi:MAG TPA: bifunctional ornithine acetyltransferase/N-acetylglutamate synthase [Fimbriimonadaceae bacterium]|nr:bifunctional ornithine acetyltransferase/N-acetylglutamate synthase [Fimbriimonadaceae bacterium]
MAVTPVGFQFAGVRCGLKNKRRDVGIVMSDRPASVAGVFTQNLVRAACVDYTKEVVEKGTLRAIVVNSGNANCCTGEQGKRDAVQMAALAASSLSIDVTEVAVAQTGVIGQLMDMAKLEAGVKQAAASLSTEPGPFLEAILTTDLVEKSAVAQVGSATIYGAGKGSGMIAPNMATMLGFLTTDLVVDAPRLDAALRKAVGVSFNCLTVDGDASTNDMVLAMANGASGHEPTDEELDGAMAEVCTSLAKQIARDGEGATKLIEVRVTGTDDPKRAALAIANSPLVKTAMFGCDPNWGRIIAAAGRSGVQFDPAKARLTIWSGDEPHVLFEAGAPAPFDPVRASTALRSDEIVIDLALGEGGSATVYTCDLGYGYVRINAEYHT